MSYRRITVEEVKVAYAVTGAKPTRGTYAGPEILFALRILRESLGSGPELFQYLVTFMRGFDGTGIHRFDDDIDIECKHHEHCLIGYADGRAAWEAMKHEA